MVDETVRVIGQLEQFTERAIRRLVLEATANLQDETPVDTGWARANWVPNIGAPFPTTAGTREQAVAGNVQTNLQQQGIASVATSYTLNQGSVYITNNVPYIVQLNEGTSAQAPAGFVQNAIARAIRTVIGRL